LEGDDDDINKVIRARAHRKSTRVKNNPVMYGQWGMPAPVQEDEDFDDTEEMIRQLLE